MANEAVNYVTNALSGIGPFVVSLWPYLLVLAVAGVAAWVYRQNKRFPLRAVIWERRGDDIITNMKDSIGRIKEDGIFKWKFRKSKDTLPPENYAYVVKCLTGIGVAHFIKYGSGQYKIIDVRDLFKVYCSEHQVECAKIKLPNGEEQVYCDKCKKTPKEVMGGKFKIIDTDDMNWKVLEFRATMERRKNKEEAFAKYGPLIGLALVVLLGIMIAYFGYEFLDNQLSKQVAACTELYTKKMATEAAKPTTPTIPIISNLMPNANSA